MNTKTIFAVLIFLSVLVKLNAQEVMAVCVPEGLPKLTKAEKAIGESTNEDTSIFKFSFNYYPTENEVSAVEGALSSDEIGNKFDQLQKLYTYTTPIAPGNPGLKTVVRKPVIYNTVIKLNKHYKKLLKKGVLTETDYLKSSSKALNVAIAAFYNNTEEFEEVLMSTKEISTLAKLFEKAEVINQ